MCHGRTTVCRTGVTFGNRDTVASNNATKRVVVSTISTMGEMIVVPSAEADLIHERRRGETAAWATESGHMVFAATVPALDVASSVDASSFARDRAVDAARHELDPPPGPLRMSML